jgi:hypothetical protein
MWNSKYPRKPSKFLFLGAKNMNQKITFRAGFSILVFALAGLLVAPAPGYSQTEGMERRDDRREDRQDARETKQTGREEGRDAKADCRDAGGSGPECRQEKREIKQDARGKARDIRRD